MKIAIIGAMEEEVELLKSKMTNKETIEKAGSEFTTGLMDGQDIVLLKCGIGKVNAAVGTTLLNEIYKPNVVINTGSAGGFEQSLNVGDIVVSTEVRYHDVDATVFGYEYGQVPRMPASYQPDDKLVAIAEKSAKEIEDVQVVKGLITSSDSFMDSAERVQFVRDQFPIVKAAEMEAGAIAQVCHQFEVPFVIIRSLSDIAGKDDNSKVTYEQFLEKASVNSARLVMNIVQKLS
jgi:adenosylhomocysteine nucleosidase